MQRIIILSMARGAQWEHPLIRRFLADAAALAMGGRLEPAMRSLAARIHAALEARARSHKPEINRVAFRNFPQLPALQRRRGALE